MDRRRTFSTPQKNMFASDYINHKRSKQKFSGTSSLANTIIQNGGNFPLVASSGYLKPYQGTYGFSSSSQTQGQPPSSYCLNQARSYHDLLDITKGKYLLTPPNPTTTSIGLNDLNISPELYCGPLYQFNYTNSGNVAQKIICNNSYFGGATGPASVDDTIIFSPLSFADQWIFVDPSFNLFYGKTSCFISESKRVLNDVEVRQNTEAQRTVDRILNMNVEGFTYPAKFSLKYTPNDCINSNNDLQKP